MKGFIKPNALCILCTLCILVNKNANNAKNVKCKIYNSMNSFAYSLDAKRPSKLFKCPACGQREFKLYCDNNTGEYLSTEVGKCNRIVKCNHHYSPKEYFQTNQLNFTKPKSHTHIVEKSKIVDFISYDLFEQSLNHDNHFLGYLTSLFGEDITHKVNQRFFIGTSKHWQGASIFWQIDSENNIHTGKIILFNPSSGKRVKTPYNHINWVHSILEKQGKLKNFHLKQCLFGEHQLNYEPRDKIIAVVESEKTAVLASVLMPEYIWLATGSLTNYNINHCEALAGKSIIVYPDLGETDIRGLTPFDKWSEKSNSLIRSLGCNIAISDLLERKATQDERKAGLDIADYLIKRDAMYGWAMNENDYPFFWDSG